MRRTWMANSVLAVLALGLLAGCATVGKVKGPPPGSPQWS